MSRQLLLCAIVAMTVAPWTHAADTQTKANAPHMTADQIVEKNVAARGGLAAWRGVKTMEMRGKMQAGGNNRPAIPVPGIRKADVMPKRSAEQAELPFVMDLARGRKVRVEIEFNGQTAIQVYNGAQGWKLRPFLNRHEVENFTEEEMKAASAQTDLDGPLVDYTAKGSKVELEGVEQVEGHDTYKLKVTDKGNHVRHVWVDSQTFLEAKVEGTPRRLDGKYHPVVTYYRDYKPVNGLVMPYVLETAVDGVKDREKVEIETIVANPKLDDSRFAMPR